MTPEVASIGIVIIFAALLGVTAYIIKQPIIPAYIVGGILIGPHCLKLIHQPGPIQTLSDLTFVFVMFVIALDLDFKRIKAVGSIVTFGTIAQVMITGLIGFVIARFWFNTMASIYLGIVFAFGSTMLEVKVLSDNKELDTLHGRITVGILLFQDILAIVALSLLSVKGFSFEIVGGTFIKSFGLVTIAVLMGQYVFPPIFRKISNNTELLTIASLGIAFLFAFIAQNQGLSASIGAFITGVSLANLPYCLELLGRVKAHRDLFLPIFFVSLGLQISVPSPSIIWPIVIITIAGITLKPIVISMIAAAFGYQKRTAFKIGSALIPISEFGLVLVAMGIQKGYLKQEVMLFSIIAMTLSMLASSYIKAEPLYSKIGHFLGFLDRIGPARKMEDAFDRDGKVFDIILIGCHNTGRYILESLQCNHTFMVVEQSLDRFDALTTMNVSTLMGDAAEPEVWERLGDLSAVKFVISTLPDLNQSLFILRYLKDKWPNIKVILSSDEVDTTLDLLKEGADFVLCPHVISGQLISSGQLNNIFDVDKIGEEKEKTISHLHGVMSHWAPICCHCGKPKLKE